MDAEQKRIEALKIAVNTFNGKAFPPGTDEVIDRADAFVVFIEKGSEGKAAIQNVAPEESRFIKRDNRKRSR